MQYQQALSPLLQALEVPQIRREYIFVLFPALAQTLIHNDRLEDARRLARQLAAEGPHTQYFIPLVEALDSAKKRGLVKRIVVLLLSVGLSACDKVSGPTDSEDPPGMVKIPAGPFIMGSDSGAHDERPHILCTSMASGLTATK